MEGENENAGQRGASLTRRSFFYFTQPARKKSLAFTSTFRRVLGKERNSPGSISPQAAARQGTSGRYYGEVWVTPKGSRFSKLGTLMGAGQGLCGKHLWQLLVRRIEVGRDERGRIRIMTIYRFAEPSVTGVRNPS